ncbi:MAG TPA: hypothetical protein DCE56_19310 [Cyanobacteria bacterium UBA8553]|nr:hypothetical protein [Cyanobacteria bacterium UBA8553]
MPILNQEQQSCAEFQSGDAIHHPEQASLLPTSEATQTSDSTLIAEAEKVNKLPLPEVPQKPRRVERLSISSWHDDPKKNEVYKISEWEVESSTGNVYTLHWDMRDKRPQCNCQGFKHHGHCKHSDAVQADWQEWVAWNTQKNSYDLAWEEKYYPF